MMINYYDRAALAAALMALVGHTVTLVEVVHTYDFTLTEVVDLAGALFLVGVLGDGTRRTVPCGELQRVDAYPGGSFWPTETADR